MAAVLLSGVAAGLWTGTAHRAFAERVGAHAPSLTATADRYDRYAVALTGYAAAVEEVGPRLLGTRGRLRQRCDELARPPHPAGGAASDAAELLGLARDFKAGYDRWADALDLCTRALSQADRADPTHDVHGFAALGHRVAGAVGAALSPFEQAVAHPSLHNLSACFQALNVDLTVLGLGLLFICPAAGAACLAAATVLAAAQVAVDAARRARGEHVSAASLGLEMAAAIPLGGNAVRGLRTADHVTHLVPGGGLLAHEGIDGGHTIAKHVGKSEDFLRNRLATDPGIRAASTFYDRQTAENSLAQLLHDNSPEVDRWLEGRRHSLTLIGSMPQRVGIVISRRGTGPVEASAVKLVLKRYASMPTGFRVHTAMVIE